MKPTPLKNLKLPGVVTATSLKLPAKLSYKELEEVLGILGQIGRSVGWWAVDAMLYAEAHLKEDQFSQIVESLGWSPHTAANALSVGRAFPPSRRREALTLGHHEALSKLDPHDQEHWLTKAEKGDKLPNGEWKRWSVAELRKRLKALGPGESAPESPSEPRTSPDPVYFIAEGRVVEVRWSAEGLVKYRVDLVSESNGELNVVGRRLEP